MSANGNGKKHKQTEPFDNKRFVEAYRTPPPASSRRGHFGGKARRFAA
jgi:hypothetical protein